MVKQLSSDHRPPFVVRFPFRMRPEREVAGLEEPAVIEDGSRSLILERNGRYHLLKCKPFDSDKAAEAFIPSIRFGLIWALVNEDTAFSLDRENISRPVYRDDPEKAGKNLFGAESDPTHGIIDGDCPAIYPSELAIAKATGGDATVKTDIMASQFLERVKEGLEAPKPTALNDQPGLELAVELYRQHFYEASGATKLLILVMALEVLSEPEPRHHSVLEMLDTWKREASEVLAELPEDSVAWVDLDSLLRSLLFTRERSIRGRIQLIVRRSVQDDPPELAETMALQARDCYDDRGTLVHEGHLPPERLSESLSKARTIVRAVLKARLKDTAW